MLLTHSGIQILSERSRSSEHFTVLTSNRISYSRLWSCRCSLLQRLSRWMVLLSYFWRTGASGSYSIRSFIECKLPHTIEFYSEIALFHPNLSFSGFTCSCITTGRSESVSIQSADPVSPAKSAPAFCIDTGAADRWANNPRLQATKLLPPCLDYWWLTRVKSCSDPVHKKGSYSANT